MQKDASYQILKKQSDNTTVVVEALKGIEQAQKRIEQLNEDGSDEHFIFDPINACVVDATETKGCGAQQAPGRLPARAFRGQF